MKTKPITIHVSPEAACAYETATAEQQRKLDVLLSLKLTEVTRSTRPLETIMSEISRKAQARGTGAADYPRRDYRYRCSLGRFKEAV
jgi:hypothetical protein